MKMIERKIVGDNPYDPEEAWEPISAGYCGLSKEDARRELSTLRRWAKSDGSKTKYRMRECTLVPK